MSKVQRRYITLMLYWKAGGKKAVVGLLSTVVDNYRDAISTIEARHAELDSIEVAKRDDMDYEAMSDSIELVEFLKGRLQLLSTHVTH